MLTEEAKALIAEPEVHLIAQTRFRSLRAHALTGWATDAIGGEALAEFAGRACYQSWSKPNPATATNAGYLRHIIEVGHESVLEHGQVTLYLTGVSRAFTHEIIRHRHFSPSQLSQRYVPADKMKVVIPPALRGNKLAQFTVVAHFIQARGLYLDLVEIILGAGEVRGTKAQKQAREAARAVLPNCTETRIVLTGNFRAWRDMIAQRATVHADAEMREVTVMIAKLLKAEFPNVFQDMQIRIECEAGVEVVEFALLD